MKKIFKIVACFGARKHKGDIIYDDEKKSAVVRYPTAEGKKAVVWFLNTERKLRVPPEPESVEDFLAEDEEAIIDYDEVLARPVDSLMFMEIALVEMASEIGIGLWRVDLTELRRE